MLLHFTFRSKKKNPYRKKNIESCQVARNILYKSIVPLIAAFRCRVCYVIFVSERLPFRIGPVAS